MAGAASGTTYGRALKAVGYIAATGSGKVVAAYTGATGAVGIAYEIGAT